VIGLGNPGRKYELTRHNAGFLFLDFFAASQLISFIPSKNDYYFAEGHVNHAPFLLIKPCTYMNLSGTAVKHVLENANISIEDILVVYDDVNLIAGDLRVRPGGSDGGHNGINSLIYHLNSDRFLRIRIGIGNSFEKGKMSDFVLSTFSEEEFSNLSTTFKFCTKLTKAFILGGTKELLDTNAKLKRTDSLNQKLND
jgi:PTH1 family peptidyl-tRNA hydrolase